MPALPRECKSSNPAYARLMLFNSFSFLLFLPIALLLFEFARSRAGVRTALLVLAVCSLFFYGYWNPVYLPLILGSIAFNYGIGWVMAARAGQTRTLKLLLIVGVAGNLGLLAYFKYAGLILEAFNQLAAHTFAIPAIVLPLAISFFTFQQIAYLVDMSRGQARTAGFIDYLVFVTFFPQLIAGPIVHHAEMMPQFGRDRDAQTRRLDLQVGVSLFVIGLAKKVLLADNLAPLADASFALADAGEPQTAALASMGLAAFTLQIYFDFSGYTDMAFGAARMFGVRLPVNFFSPYQATSIIEFWRRWHITLSRFLRDYLYIPLGGNRKGSARRYLNLMLTMLLGGLWHGAAVTFIVWGGLHGLMLCANHGWIRLLTACGLDSLRNNAVYRGLAWLVTLAGVMLAWAVFRAETPAGAALLLENLLSPGAGASLQSVYSGRVFDLHLLVRALLQGDQPLSELWRYPFYGDLILLAAGAAICLMAPNSMEITRAFQPSITALPEPSKAAPRRTLQWQPGWQWATAAGLVFTLGVLSISRVSPFLYFQF